MKRKRTDDKTLNEKQPSPLHKRQKTKHSGLKGALTAIWQYLVGKSYKTDEVPNAVAANASLAEEEEEVIEKSCASHASADIEKTAVHSTSSLEEEEQSDTPCPELPAEVLFNILSFIPSANQTRLVSHTFNNLRDNMSEEKRKALQAETQHFIQNKAAILERTKNNSGQENEVIKKDYQRLEFLNTSQPMYTFLDRALNKLNCSIILSEIEKFTFYFGHITFKLKNCFLTRFPDKLLSDERLAPFWGAVSILVLKGNKLTSLPENIVKLTNLRILDVSQNQILKLPEIIGQLPLLGALYASNNKLTCLPGSLCQLTELAYLKLEHNYLSSLPESVAKLDKLESLNVSNNQLSELPKDIGELKKLARLDVSHNKLSSKPEVVSDCKVIAHNNPFVQDNLMKKKP